MPGFTPPVLYRSLGQLAAIVGLVCFTWEFILAARWRWLESLLSGLNRVYVYHHFIGGISLIALLLHPLFLGMQYALISVTLASNFFLPPLSETGHWLGTIALAGLILLLILTFYIKLKYETWKFTHQFLGLVYAVAFIHVLTVPSILSQNQPLKICLIILFTIGLTAYLYTVVIKRYILKKRFYRVQKVTAHPGQVVELVLKPEIDKLVYQPGQFVFITIINPAIPRERHPFSLTSNPKSPLLSLAVKAVGDFTASLSLIKSDDRVVVEGPYGHFTQAKIKNPNQVWLAGGIGITPFLGFLRTLKTSTLSDRQIWLFYSFRGQAEAAFLPELVALARELPWFNLRLRDTLSQGRLSLAAVARLVPALSNFDLLLCGPEPMTQALSKQAQDLKVPKSQIHTEVFRLYN